MKLEPIIPFEPITTDTIQKGDEWIAQVKWDGVRILTYFDGNEARLFNRKLNERTLQYPEFIPVTHYCSASSVILDGEIVALHNGNPSFHQVMKRDGARKAESISRAKVQTPVIYMIFDILNLNGDWITDQSLRERQQILGSIITQNENVQLVRSHHDSDALFKVVVNYDLEGIVIKDLNSKYAVNGKDKRWQKKKVFKDLFAVVGGVTYRSGIVNALLLGLYDGMGQLWYIGRVGTGKLTQQDWRNLTTVVRGLRIQERPFVNSPDRSKEAHWIQPGLSVKINFLEWTRNKTLRQPSVQSVVNVDVKECTFNQT